MMISRWSNKADNKKREAAHKYHDRILDHFENGGFGVKWKPMKVENTYLASHTAYAGLLVEPRITPGSALDKFSKFLDT